MIKIGDKFPTFSLPDQDGKMVDSASLQGHKTVVFFYPKDDTGGCTAEACEFRDLVPDFGDVKIIGVSPDSAKSHLKFIAKNNLNFTLLADTDRSLIEACGLWIEKMLYGKKYMGVDRTTYVLDEHGAVTHVFAKVKPQGHAAEVKAALG